MKPILLAAVIAIGGTAAAHAQDPNAPGVPPGDEYTQQGTNPEGQACTPPGFNASSSARQASRKAWATARGLSGLVKRLLDGNADQVLRAARDPATTEATRADVARRAGVMEGELRTLLDTIRGDAAIRAPELRNALAGLAAGATGALFQGSTLLYVLVNLLLVFVGAAAFLAGMMYFRPWDDI